MEANPRKFFAVLVLAFVLCKDKKSSSPSPPPVCPECYTIVVYPPDGGIVFPYTAVAGISLHPSPITTVQIRIVGAKTRSTEMIEGNRRWRTKLVLEPGTYTLSATAWDDKGFSSSDSITFTVIPLPSSEISKLYDYLAILSGDIGNLTGLITKKMTAIVLPVPGQRVFGVFPVVGVSFPPTPTAVLVEVEDSAGKRVSYPAPASLSWSVAIDTLSLSDGPAKVKATAFWELGRAVSEVAVEISNSSVPEITVSISRVISGSVTKTAILVYPPEGATVPASVCNATPPLCNAVGVFLSSKAPSSVTVWVKFQGPTWRDDVYPIIKSKCLGCHGTAPFVTYELVFSPSTCGGKRYVVPFKPSESYLFEKIASATPSCGQRMPPTSPLPSAEIQTFEDWILQGAGNFGMSRVFDALVFPDPKYPATGTFAVPLWWVDTSGEKATGKAVLKVYLDGDFVYESQVTLVPSLSLF